MLEHVELFLELMAHSPFPDLVKVLACMGSLQVSHHFLVLRAPLKIDGADVRRAHEGLS